MRYDVDFGYWNSEEEFILIEHISTSDLELAQMCYEHISKKAQTITNIIGTETIIEMTLNDDHVSESDKIKEIKYQVKT